MRKSGNPKIASAAVRHQNSAPEIRFSRYAAEKRIMLGMLVLPDVGPGGTLCARMSVVGEKNLVLYLYFGAKKAAGAGWAGDSGGAKCGGGVWRQMWTTAFGAKRPHTRIASPIKAV